MSTYWSWVTKEMEVLPLYPADGNSASSAARIRKGTVYLKPTDDRTIDITDPHFFSMEWRFIVDFGAGYFNVISPSTDGMHYPSDLQDQDVYPQIWTRTDKLAKSVWSTVLIDLGQTKPSNLLLDPSKLHDFTSDFDEAHQNLANAHPGPEMYTFNTSTNSTGPLGTTPSVINARYLCNVPRRKAASTLAWSIIVANLVFLQATWTLFKLIVDNYLASKVPRANYCAGCLGESLLGPTDQQYAANSLHHDSDESYSMGRLSKRPGYHRQSTNSHSSLVQHDSMTS